LLSASGRKIVFARGHIVAAKAVYDTGRGKDGGRISGTHVTPLVRPVGMPVLTPLEEAAPDPVAVARQIKKLGCHVGVTLNPATPVESIWPVLDEVDLVLVMSVVPGFSGQSFMPEVLPKCEAIRQRLRPNQRLQIDGGIKPDNIHHARNAGVDWFVVASAIFDQPDRAKVIAELRKGLR